MAGDSPRKDAASQLLTGIVVGERLASNTSPPEHARADEVEMVPVHARVPVVARSDSSGAVLCCAKMYCSREDSQVEVTS